MPLSRYRLLFIGLLLLLPIEYSVDVQAQTIRSGDVHATVDAQNRIRVALDANDDLLSNTLPTQVVYVDGRAVRAFAPTHERGTLRTVRDVRGRGTQLTLRGRATFPEGKELTQIVRVTAYERYADLLIFRSTYLNTGTTPVTVDSVLSQQYELTSSVDTTSGQPTFWTFQGVSYASRPDWVLPLGADSTHYRGARPSRQFDQPEWERRFRRYNYLGMNASDYGGGVPVLDVWTPEGGMAIGHLSPTTELVALPIRMANMQTVRLRLVEPHARTLAPGDSMRTVTSFVRYHSGDYYTSLRAYTNLMAAQGVTMPDFPETAYEPIWCAWGYGRNFETESILATLPKVKELGLDWVVLDDGWQVAEGDWTPHPERFPDGDASMKAFVDHIHDAGLKAKLWWVPLAADPGSRTDEQHPEWALLNPDGSPRTITWWDSQYLCPAVRDVRTYTQDLIRRFLNDWGYDGLKIDGQNLNAVPPCYNETHHHLTPDASVHAVPLYFQDIYSAAMQADSSAVVELCPCGDAAAFHNMPFNNQPVASDPTSSWQIRLKGKTFKALMGPQTPYYGDHVELSDGGDDFATSVGIGAVVGTKFTWAPRSTLDEASWMEQDEPAALRLTDAREAHWKKWIGLYEDKMLPKGEYRGDLYDIGYDLPEAHAIAKDGRMYYAFYADQWDGAVELRGLSAGTYEVRDYVNDKLLGTVSGPSAKLSVTFSEHLLLEVSAVE